MEDQFPFHTILKPITVTETTTTMFPTSPFSEFQDNHISTTFTTDSTSKLSSPPPLQSSSSDSTSLPIAITRLTRKNNCQPNLKTIQHYQSQLFLHLQACSQASHTLIHVDILFKTLCFTVAFLFHTLDFFVTLLQFTSLLHLNKHQQILIGWLQ